MYACKQRIPIPISDGSHRSKVFFPPSPPQTGNSAADRYTDGSPHRLYCTEETLRHLLPFLIPHRRNRKDRGNMLVSEPFNPEAPSSLSHFPFFFLASILREFARFRVLLRFGIREREKVVGDGGRVWRNDSIVNESCSAPPPKSQRAAIGHFYSYSPPLPPFSHTKS